MTLSGQQRKELEEKENAVLIPLLVDDPLWVLNRLKKDYPHLGLNPSFSG